MELLLSGEVARQSVQVQQNDSAKQSAQNATEIAEADADKGLKIDAAAASGDADANNQSAGSDPGSARGQNVDIFV